MTKIKFHLRDAYGVLFKAEREGATVPRKGDLVTDDSGTFYEVEEVIWAHDTDSAFVVGVKA